MQHFKPNTRSNTHTCVTAEQGFKATDADGATVDGVRLGSDIAGNDGQLIITQDEFNAFIAQAKAGLWDDLVTQVVTPEIPDGEKHHLAVA